MAQKTLTARLKQKYDTATNWNTNNPVLLAGELGFESNTGKFKIGDGTTAWNSLGYVNDSSYKGTYSSTTQYHVGDIVEYPDSVNSMMYICIQDALGVAPTGVAVWNNSYWRAMSYDAAKCYIQTGNNAQKKYLWGNNVRGSNYVTPSSSSEKIYMKDDYLFSNDKKVIDESDLYPAFSETSTYLVGDVVIYNHLYYQCTTAVTTAGEWDSSNWTQKTFSQLCNSQGGSSTDVQVNGTSIVSNNVANLITNTAYNASSNKLATMSDLPTDYIKNTSSTTQTISVTGNMGDSYDTPLMLKSNVSSDCWLGFKNSGDTIFGYLGAYSTSGDTHRLKFYDTATHILAYTSDIPDDYVKTSSSTSQTIAVTGGSSVPTIFKSDQVGVCGIGFADKNNDNYWSLMFAPNSGYELNLIDKNGDAHSIAYKSDLPSAITEISTQYIRITDLSTGVYKLTYNGTKYIYYSGTTLTSTHTVAGGAGAVILTVNRYSTTYWHWYYINGSTSYGTIYFGYTSSSTGATSSKQLNSLLTSISSYVKDNLTYSTSGTTYALSAYQGYKLNQNKQDKLPTTTTAGQVLKSTSTAGTVEWGTVTPTLPSDVAYFEETSGTPSASYPYYTKNETDSFLQNKVKINGYTAFTDVGTNYGQGHIDFVQGSTTYRLAFGLVNGNTTLTFDTPFSSIIWANTSDSSTADTQSQRSTIKTIGTAGLTFYGGATSPTRWEVWGIL